MSATDELRRMLDERGVEWDGCILMGAPITFWGEQERDGRWPYRYWEHDGWASFSADPKSELFTPEQAIAATLGSCNCSNSERTGTCTADETDTMECVCDGIGHYGKSLTVHVMECSECGRTYEHVNGDYEYCPHCGRRIEVNDG